MKDTSSGADLRYAVFPLLLCAALPGVSAASGYEFDGVGARAIARGGAVIADAADWTAIYWNPANLADVKAREAGLELKAGRSYTRDGNSFNLGALGNPFDKKKAQSPFFFGSAGAAVPLGETSALGFGLYLPLLQGSKFTDTDPTPAVYRSLDYEGSAAIAVGNFSYARRLSEKFSAAAGVNLIYGRLRTDATHDFAASPLAGFAPDVVRQELDGSGTAAEGVLGAKYRLGERFSLGAVFRSGAKVRIEGEAKAVSGALGVQASDFKFTLKQPPTSGVGAAWEAAKTLTVTCDLTQTYWKGFSNEIDYKTDGLSMLPDQANTFDWRNSYKFRAGALWRYSPDGDLLAGYAFDTPAIDAGSLDFSAAIDVPMHRFSAAASRRWGPVEGTLAALAGYNSRNAGGVNYRLGGWYFIGELKYKF